MSCNNDDLDTFKVFAEVAIYVSDIKNGEKSRDLDNFLSDYRYFEIDTANDPDLIKSEIVKFINEFFKFKEVE